MAHLRDEAYAQLHVQGIRQGLEEGQGGILRVSGLEPGDGRLLLAHALGELSLGEAKLQPPADHVADDAVKRLGALPEFTELGVLQAFGEVLLEGPHICLRTTSSYLRRAIASSAGGVFRSFFTKPWSSTNRR